MKRNKQRRAYLKRFSSTVVNTGKAERLDKHTMRDLYGASSMIGTPTDSKHNTYTMPIPETIMKMPWRSDKMQGVDRYIGITIYNLGDKKLELFFCGTKWFFRKEHTGEVKFSIVYGSKINAEIALEHNRIIWLKTQG